MICADCLRPMGKTVTNGDLTVSTEPAEATWRGQPIDGINPYRARLLAELAHRGDVARDTFLAKCLPEDNEPNAVTLGIARLRKILPPGLSIMTLPYFGYRLIMENEHG